MTIRDFLDRKNRDRDEMPLFLASDRTPLEMWTDNDPKYDAQVLKIDASDELSPIVLTDWDIRKENGHDSN